MSTYDPWFVDNQPPLNTSLRIHWTEIFTKTNL